MKQSIENQALERFLFAFSLMRKNYPQPTRPTHLARFLQAKTRFFLYISVLLKN
jgi:hypothetical protein